MTGAFALTAIERVWHGPGVIKQVGEEAASLGADRVFVITSETLAAHSPHLATLQEILGSRYAGVSAAHREHTPRTAVLAAAAQAREAGADALLSFGGGSQIDCAKIVALVLAEGITDTAGLDAFRIRYSAEETVVPGLTRDQIRHIAVPTTLSAAEFTALAGITDEARQVKDLFMDRRLAATAVFMDPRLTLSTPMDLWMASGFRAIDHCVETFLSSVRTPLTDALVLAALEVLVRDLPQTLAQPEALEPRERCQWAAWMSFFGVANVMLGLSHGIGHQLGARCGVSHGATSALMLPHVLDFNLPQTVDRQAILARALGAETGIDDEATAREVSVRLRRLVTELGLPSRLRDVGVTRADFEGLATDALEDMVVATNPRPVTHDDVLALLEAAY